jgi:hypothetical protein
VNGDKAIRYSTIAAVSAVALVAGFVSYRHALQVVTVHGETGLLARAYPLTIDGLIYGPVGAIVAAWPAPALVISYELLMLVIRSSAAPVPGGVPGEFASLNGHAAAAAELFAADLQAGRVPGIRAIRSGLQVGQDKASQVQAYLRTRIRT